MAFHGFSEEFQRSYPVSSLGNVSLEHLAFMVDGSPKLMSFASDLHKHFVQMPPPLRDLPHGTRSLFADHTREQHSEPTDPEPDALMADVDATLMQQIFDIAKGEWKADVRSRWYTNIMKLNINRRRSRS